MRKFDQALNKLIQTGTTFIVLALVVATPVYSVWTLNVPL